MVKVWATVHVEVLVGVVEGVVKLDKGIGVVVFCPGVFVLVTVIVPVIVRVFMVGQGVTMVPRYDLQSFAALARLLPSAYCN